MGTQNYTTAYTAELESIRDYLRERAQTTPYSEKGDGKQGTYDAAVDAANAFDEWVDSLPGGR